MPELRVPIVANNNVLIGLAVGTLYTILCGSMPNTKYPSAKPLPRSSVLAI